MRKLPDVTWTHPFIPAILNLVPKDSKKILDVGCGRGLVGAICKIYRDPEIIWGIDIFDDYLNFCKANMPYDNLIQHDLCVGLPEMNMTFDVGVCLEVIEHLEKSEGLHLLMEMSKICRRVIVSTPAQFRQQDTYDNNPHQRHLSLWSAKDFERMNYITKAARSSGIRILGRSIKFVSAGLAKFLSEGTNDQWIIAYKDSKL